MPTINSALNHPQAHCCLVIVPSLVTPCIGKAELLQRVFVQNYTADNGFLPCLDSHERPKCNLSHTYFTTALVRRAIKKLYGIKLKEALELLFVKTCLIILTLPT